MIKARFMTVCVVALVFVLNPVAQVHANDLVDPMATDGAKRLFTYLQSLKDKTENKVVSGQFLGFWDRDADLDGDIYTMTGKRIGLMAVDYGMHAQPDDDFSRINGKLIDHANNGGIVLIISFWNNPLKGDWGADPRVNLIDVVTPGTAVNATWNAELDRAARGLGDLQDNGIPVIFNAFTEMNNMGDRWYAGNGDNFQKLWIYTYEYLTQEKGLHNLIWFFAPMQGCGVEYYPGGDYVDIAGSSSYDKNCLGTLDGRCFSKFADFNKPYAVAEYGPCGPTGCGETGCDVHVDYRILINGIKAYIPEAMFWMSWNSTWSMAYHYHITELLNDPWVLTRDEIDYRTVNPTASSPVISPSGGDYTGGVEVTLFTSTSGAEIRYTVDGSAVTGVSPVYATPFTLSADATVKARTFKTGLDSSSERSADFTVTIDQTAPTVSSVIANADPLKVRVIFSEAVDSAVAEAAGNYSITSGITVSAAALQADGKTVILTTGTLSEDTPYTLTVDNVKDLWENVITAGSQKSFSYYASPPEAAWLAFNETDGTVAADLSGNNHTGTLVGGPVWTGGKLDGALLLDGIDDYVSYGSGTGLDFADGAEFTFTGWVKTSDDYGVIISQRHSVESRSVIDIAVGYDGAVDDAGKLMALVRQDGGRTGYARVTGGTVNDDEWHLVTLTRKTDGTVELFMDGVSQGASQGTESGGLITSDLCAVGAERRWLRDSNGTADQQFLAGTVDDVRIYNHELTGLQMEALLSAGNVGIRDGHGSVLPAYREFSGYAALNGMLRTGEGMIVDLQGNSVSVNAGPVKGVYFVRYAADGMFQKVLIAD